MSKDIPEVGDIWLDEEMNIKLLIVCKSEYNNSFDCLVHDMYDNTFYTKTLCFSKDCKYLYKSKTNLSDLFKMENK